MTTAMLKQTIKYWSYLLPYTHVPRNKEEYERLLCFVDQLMHLLRQKKDEKVVALLELVAKNIEEYESKHYPTYIATPIEMLEFLMEQHELEQGDLAEIGSQSLVSKILSGERKLTVEHIKKLSKRFNISPAVFIEIKNDS
ncbi:MAG: helix-turn-helix domain-containing protein [Gammaproteobacteria bacterium]|nr:helix-turn-helix domain-containing protein [Gammaproteobacteria bacterium]